MTTPSASLKPLEPTVSYQNDELSWALSRLAHYRSESINEDQMRVALARAKVDVRPERLAQFCQDIGLEAPARRTSADETDLPLLHHSADSGWGLVTERSADGKWMLEKLGERTPVAAERLQSLYSVRFRSLVQGESFDDFLRLALRNYRGLLVEGALASLFLSLLALLTALYSMQVYDRVIPTRNTDTLIVLTVGVAMAILLELTMKWARSHLVDSAAVGIDTRLSRQIYERLLDVRLDQLPASVGSLASQLRSYEQVRSFYTSSTLFALVDVPMALLFFVVIALVGSPVVAMVPLVAAALGLLLGLSRKKKLHALAMQGALAANRKTGILVETVEGAETIKAGRGGWKFLARWLQVSEQAIAQDLEMRKVGETTVHLSAALQQIGYVAIVALGSLLVVRGEMTMGALIACSIIGGRIMAPIVALPAIISQYAHAQAAKKSLNGLFSLGGEYEGVSKPLVPAALSGQYRVEGLEYRYRQDVAALTIDKLSFKAGEKVAIIGAIGSGKSTLLKMLSGLYRPTKGRVLLDDLDVRQIHRTVLGTSIGLLQQEHRLFEGTLRENLLIGMAPPDDETLTEALRRSGLQKLVSAHPKGLDLPIFEGGKGLSGGQRQLVAFTRLLLFRPNILLLDEPTANMDGEQEGVCLKLLDEERMSDRTMVIVTHKPNLLGLVDRLIVMAGGKVYLDGPKEAVIARLAQQQPGAPGNGNGNGNGHGKVNGNGNATTMAMDMAKTTGMATATAMPRPDGGAVR